MRAFLLILGYIFFPLDKWVWRIWERSGQQFASVALLHEQIVSLYYCSFIVSRSQAPFLPRSSTYTRGSVRESRGTAAWGEESVYTQIFQTKTLFTTWLKTPCMHMFHPGDDSDVRPILLLEIPSTILSLIIRNTPVIRATCKALRIAYNVRLVLGRNVEEDMPSMGIEFSPISSARLMSCWLMMKVQRSNNRHFFGSALFVRE